MSRSQQSLGVALAILLSLVGATARAAANGHVRGVVADQSKGVLPGVTITATGADGNVLATAVTDAAGRYDLGPLAPGAITLTFDLEGFSQATYHVTVASDADAIVNAGLTLAPQSETVVVYGKVLSPPPPPPPPPPPVARPRPVTHDVPEHDRDAVCAPAKLSGTPESFGTVLSRRYAANQLYAKGDELVIDRGRFDGLAIGQNFTVRRSYSVERDRPGEMGEHTAGLVQIVSTDVDSAVAVVIYACDEIIPGDRLASFHPEPIRPTEPSGTPDFRRSSKILFFDIGQSLGAPRRMMVIDHGSAFGIRPGQRLTLFRRRRSDGSRPFVIGEATVVAVRFDSATIRVDNLTDAVLPGDWAAVQR